MCFKKIGILGLNKSIRLRMMNSCGLTAFSNLLQLLQNFKTGYAGCGLTAFSNLLQPVI